MKLPGNRESRVRGGATARFLADVEHLAEAACETAEDLHARGLGQLAAKFERALVRLGGVKL